jgi:hypothetical protein
LPPQQRVRQDPYRHQEDPDWEMRRGETGYAERNYVHFDRFNMISPNSRRSMWSEHWGGRQ